MFWLGVQSFTIAATTVLRDSSKPGGIQTSAFPLAPKHELPFLLLINHRRVAFLQLTAEM